MIVKKKTFAEGSLKLPAFIPATHTSSISITYSDNTALVTRAQRHNGKKDLQPELEENSYDELQTALFNLQSLVLVLLLFICTCTYVHGLAPSFLDSRKDGYVDHSCLRILPSDQLQNLRISLASRADWGKA